MCLGSHGSFLSLASLSLSARFPASCAGDVSSLFKSGGFLYPRLLVGVREEEEEAVGGEWCLPPTEVFYLLVFMSVLQRMGARWLLEEEVAHHGGSAMFPVSVFRSVSAVLG